MTSFDRQYSHKCGVEALIGSYSSQLKKVFDSVEHKQSSRKHGTGTIHAEHMELPGEGWVGCSGAAGWPNARWHMLVWAAPQRQPCTQR